MSDIFKNNRICPNPQQWNKLWEILNSKSDEKVPAPLILAAWWHTSDEEKLRRFQVHLKLAEELDEDGEIQSYLESINESDWYHKGE